MGDHRIEKSRGPTKYLHGLKWNEFDHSSQPYTPPLTMHPNSFDYSRSGFDCKILMIVY